MENSHLDQLLGHAAHVSLMKEIFPALTVANLAKVQEVQSEDWYTEKNIAKERGKTRTLHVPFPPLKKLQRELLPTLGDLKVPDCLYGCRPEIDAVRGVRHACEAFVRLNGTDAKLRAIFQTDIRNFFTSITIEQIRTALAHALGATVFDDPDIHLCANVVTDLCSNAGYLPQGAPTSPVISNLVGAQAFDGQIQDLLKKEIGHGAVYMRYADDITVFSPEDISEETRAAISDILQTEGFETSRKKTSYHLDAQTTKVLGVQIQKHDGEDIRFRLRPDTAKKWAAGMFSLMRKNKNFFKRRAFIKHRPVQRTLGRLAHAAHIGRHGHDPHGQSHDTLLPKPLAHAWGHFQEKFQRRLPAGHEYWYRKDGYEPPVKVLSDESEEE